MEPDITPQRMGATDVASLAPIEVYAILSRSKIGFSW